MLLSLLGSQLNAISQNGFRVIQKAESNVNEGNSKKALKLLNKAEKMDYGFCGNAYIEAENRIDFLRSMIYLKNKNYELARASLDSIVWFSERNDIDSIKVWTYQQELGSKYLNRIIDSSLKKSIVKCNENDCYGIIPLKNKETTLKFKIWEDYLVYYV